MKLRFGGVSGRLPAGIHTLTWSEAEELLAYNDRRKMLMGGLLAACRALALAGVTRVYVDGSFATKKANPGDWDACFEIARVDPTKLDSVFFDFSNERAAQKAKYLGEMFFAEGKATLLGEPYLSFFQHTKDGKPKGIVVIDLGTLP
ncbi:hypothetical protein OSH11_02095 [Kaistia dalseonensis]|uniref:Uncharacterized protein n=1 Tax=Kaistia dalseonensis TaxID=410840 RepID=A0ABU0H1Y1_9HYPH|nr:hypothetical protein [Kaistia dalseonensis]MCX5493487.1 hypothetical protein [Kaistia dalseonensis]MDQ0436047.1 hypothetical protein [Kaistia dalseonensis]